MGRALLLLLCVSALILTSCGFPVSKLTAGKLIKAANDKRNDASIAMAMSQKSRMLLSTGSETDETDSTDSTDSSDGGETDSSTDSGSSTDSSDSSDSGEDDTSDSSTDSSDSTDGGESDSTDSTDSTDDSDSSDSGSETDSSDSSDSSDTSETGSESDTSDSETGSETDTNDCDPSTADIVLSDGWSVFGTSWDGTYVYDDATSSYVNGGITLAYESGEIYLTDGTHVLFYTTAASDWTDDSNPLTNSDSTTWEYDGESGEYTVGTMSVTDCDGADLGTALCGDDGSSIFPDIYDCATTDGGSYIVTLSQSSMKGVNVFVLIGMMAGAIAYTF